MVCSPFRRRRASDTGWIRTMPPTSSELTQKPEVVLPELPDVVDRVLEHRNPLRAHAEGEATHLVRIVAAVSQDGGMHHAGAHDLQPAGPLGQPVRVRVFLWPVDVHLNTRLGK